MSARERKRLQTRERLLEAAVTEFKRDGMAAADIGAIVSAAGVAHGTFFFHFATKEHVLLELERREELRIAGSLAAFFNTPHTVEDTLSQMVRELEDLEERLGSKLFKDFLALHFSTTRPPQEERDHHPVIIAVISELERARDRGELPPGTDVFHQGVFFLLGMYALLVTTPEAPEIRTPIVEKYVTITLNGMTAAPR
ncbi:TetR/AcrR family transcriptional regulator [Williamsia sp.]|uniref:TetR/AcrR family transcriptional regulator n=1 Tax=Williamsia sp. TaxID=1872085 RepID=UPI002F95A634